MRETIRAKNKQKVAAALGVTAFIVYCSNLSALGHGDPTPNVFTSLSLAQHAEPFLNRMVHSQSDVTRFNLVTNKDGNVTSSYGLGPALVASPVFLVADMWDGKWNLSRVHMTGKIAASIISASTVSLVFLILCNFCAQLTAASLALLYAFGTPSWSTLSQALWQQTAACWFLAIGLWMAFNRSLTSSRAFISGMAIGCAFFCRPIHAITLVALGLFYRRRESLAFVLGSLPPLFATALWNRVASATSCFGMSNDFAFFIMLLPFLVGLKKSAG